MARILEVCDELRDLLTDRLPPAAEVDRSFSPDVNRLTVGGGKRVWVFPAGYADAQRLARARVAKEYKVLVVTAELYDLPASADATGAVPPEWVDDRIDWVEDNVFDLLNETGVREEDRLLGSLWPQTCDVTVVYDPVKLDQQKTFWSEVEVAYREAVKG